jgi:hypothetical protein
VDELALQRSISEAAWQRVGQDIWRERLWRRLRRPERAGVAQRLVRGVHDALGLVVDGRWTEQADRRLRDAYAEAAAAVGLEAPPWH